MTLVSRNEFINFLKDNDILTAVIAALISSHVSDLANSLIDNILLPIISSDSDGDGNPDINKLKKYKFKLGSITLNIGSFLVTFIKFTFILFFIYLISKLIKKDSSNLDLNWERYSPVKV
jgi:large-conductance mechanosensitive channel